MRQRRKEAGVAHVVHKSFPSKDVCEEASGILHVHTALLIRLPATGSKQFSPQQDHFINRRRTMAFPFLSYTALKFCETRRSIRHVAKERRKVRTVSINAYALDQREHGTLCCIDHPHELQAKPYHSAETTHLIS